MFLPLPPPFYFANNSIISVIASGCSYCARRDSVTRTEHIFALPSLLMFELKRFDNDLNKLCTYASAPEVITMNNKTFQLYATCFLVFFIHFTAIGFSLILSCSITKAILSEEVITMLLSRKTTSGTSWMTRRFCGLIILPKNQVRLRIYFSLPKLQVSILYHLLLLCFMF
jgi:hypothetical protein